MPHVLIGTSNGCRVLGESGDRRIELAGRSVSALAAGGDGACAAVVDRSEIWRRDARGQWRHLATSPLALESLHCVNRTFFGGGSDEAAIVRLDHDGRFSRLQGFDECPGRANWVANGPPLSIRSLASTADRGAIMAVVHVGGIPRSSDGGETWHPTLPIELDAHEVAAHRSRPNIVAAAAAVGLCLSEDHGRNWRIVGHHSGTLTSLAIAILGDEVLYSVQDGPFASETVIWRYSLTTGICEQVRQGLPERLGGKIDTGHIAAGEQQAAVVDGSGNIWISSSGSTGWRQVEGDVGDASCILMI